MAAAIGALLVVALGAWFLSWRAVLIGVVAIPLSLVAAGLVLSLRGVPIDAMVLAGLAAALVAVIDDVVTQVENVLRRLRQQRAGGDRSTAAVVFEACAELHGPMVYATLIAVLAVAPVLLLGGSAGAFFGPLAVSYVLALLASLAVALTVTPALAFAAAARRSARSARAARRAVAPASLRRDRRAHRRRPAPDVPRRRPRRAGRSRRAAPAELVAASSFHEGDVRVSWKTAPGTSLPETRRIATQVSKELELIPGVSNVTAHIGRAITGDQAVDVESGQIGSASIPKRAMARRSRPSARRSRATRASTARCRATSPPRWRKGWRGRRSRRGAHPGPEREGLRREAEKVAQALSGIAGIANLRVENPVEAPQVAIKVDLAAAGRVGLKPGDVRRAAATVFSGLEVGNLYEQQKVFEVVVWGTPNPARASRIFASS